MSKRRKNNVMELKIMQVASRMFLEKGYSNTTISAIGDELNMSKGHIMFYFSSKEHMLAKMVQMLCDFREGQLKEGLEKQVDPWLMAGMELLSMVLICEESPSVRDFYQSCYSYPSTLDIIRKNDIQRAKTLYSEYCKDWTDEQFTEIETLMSGIEYSTIMTTEHSPSAEYRIEGAFHAFLLLYHVPEERRTELIKKLYAIDREGIGLRAMREFENYIIEEQKKEMLARTDGEQEW